MAVSRVHIALWIYESVGIVVACLMSALCASLGYKLFCGEHRLRWNELSLDERTAHISAISVFVFGAAFGLQIAIQNLFTLVRGHFFVPWYLWSLLLFLFSLYLFLIFRIFSVFKHSVFAVRPFVLRIHIAIWSTTAVAALSVYFFLLFGAHHETMGTLLTSLVPLMVGAWGHLLWSFNHKLFQLVLLQRRTVIDSGNTVHQLTEQQLRILRTVRKQSLLGTIIILCGAAFGMGAVAGSAVLGEKYLILSDLKNPKNHIVAVAFNLLAVVALSGCAVALYLGFAVNLSLYSWCCKYCDGRCQVLCDRTATSKINAQRECADRQCGYIPMASI